MALFVSKVTHDFIRRLAEEYLEDGMTMKRLAQRYGSSDSTISNILFRGVSEGIIDEVSSAAIANKVYYCTDNIQRAKVRWQKALILREAMYVQEEIQYVSERLKELKFQIKSYDDYFSGDPNAPSKITLQNQYSSEAARLEQLKIRLQELKGC